MLKHLPMIDACHVSHAEYSSSAATPSARASPANPPPLPAACPAPSPTAARTARSTSSSPTAPAPPKPIATATRRWVAARHASRKPSFPSPSFMLLSAALHRGARASFSCRSSALRARAPLPPSPDDGPPWSAAQLPPRSPPLRPIDLSPGRGSPAPSRRVLPALSCLSTSGTLPLTP